MAAKKKAAKALTRDELEAMSKDDLAAEAEKRGITVKRGDGAEGDPLKDDYVAALAADSESVESAGSKGERAKGLDETVPGGHYISEDGTHVNAHGQEIDEDTGEIVEQDKKEEE